MVAGLFRERRNDVEVLVSIHNCFGGDVTFR